MPIRSFDGQTEEFNSEALALANQPNVRCRQIALEIGIKPNMLSCWKRESEQVQE